jgi:hypothetical protein
MLVSEANIEHHRGAVAFRLVAGCGSGGQGADADYVAPVWIDISIADARTMIRVAKAYEIVVAARGPGRHS